MRYIFPSKIFNFSDSHTLEWEIKYIFILGELIRVQFQSLQKFSFPELSIRSIQTRYNTSKNDASFFLAIQTPQSRLQLNFKTLRLPTSYKFEEILVQNICSSRLADPRIFPLSVRARKPIRSSDVGRVGTVLYYNRGRGGGRGRKGGGNVYNRNGGFNFTRLSRVLQTNCTSKWAPFSFLPFRSWIHLNQGFIFIPGIIPCSTRWNVVSIVMIRIE